MRRLIAIGAGLALFAAGIASCSTNGHPARDGAQQTRSHVSAPYFVGDFETGDLTQWPYLGDAGLSRTPPGSEVVSSPVPPGNSHALKAYTELGASAAYVEQNDFQLPWEVIGANTWHRMRILLPSGTNPAFPGKFTVNKPGGWNIFVEWHNRTDAASGWPNVPDSYLSPYIGIHNNGKGTPRFVFRTAGGTPRNPVLKEFYHPSAYQPDRWYDMLVHFIVSDDPSVGFFEWYVDGRLIVSGHAPTGYRLADGSSGALFEVGHYRAFTTTPDTVYIASVMAGPTRASVGG